MTTNPYENGAVWRGTDKPAGTPFYAPRSYSHLPDCPVCKFGTPSTRPDGSVHCADCKAVLRPQTKNTNQKKGNQA